MDVNASAGSLVLLLPVAMVIAATLGIVFIIRAVKKARADKVVGIRKYYGFLFICVAVMALSWLFNMGWIRFALVFSGIPLFLCVLFLAVNFHAVPAAAKHNRFKGYIFLSGITYLLPYWLLPDGGDAETGYLLMGLITDDNVIACLMMAAPIVFFAHIALLLMECIDLYVCKKIKKQVA